MSKDTTHRLSVLTDELSDVLKERVEGTLPLAEQEETDLRDLEKACRAA
jgi:hypothetical protein